MNISESSSPPAREEVDAALRAWVDRLVPGWDVYVLWDQQPDQDDTRAMIACSDYYQRAPIRLDAGWENGWADHSPPNSDPRYEVEVALVHELLHAKMRDAERLIGQMGDGHLHRDVFDWIDKQWTNFEEGFIESMAHTLVRLSPVMCS